MNHGEEYWGLVGQFSPDYKLHRRWLNEHKDAVFEEVHITLTPDNTQEETSGTSTNLTNENK